MLEILTIIKEIGESGAVNYTVNGNLPIDEAAKALVIVAFNANKPEKEVISGPEMPGSEK